MNAKCKNMFMFNLQAGPNGATRTGQLRRAMAANAKVRNVLIARELMRIKCANLWGLITPMKLLIKPKTQKSHHSNLGGRDRKSTGPPNHNEPGKHQQHFAGSTENSDATAATANISMQEEQNKPEGHDSDNNKQFLATKIGAEENSARQLKINRGAVDYNDAGVDSADAGVDSASSTSIEQNEANRVMAIGGADNNPAQRTPVTNHDVPATDEQKAPPFGTGPDTVPWSDIKRRRILGSDDELVGSTASLSRICTYRNRFTSKEPSGNYK